MPEPVFDTRSWNLPTLAGGNIGNPDMSIYSAMNGGQSPFALSVWGGAGKEIPFRAPPQPNYGAPPTQMPPTPPPQQPQAVTSPFAMFGNPFAQIQQWQKNVSPFIGNLAAASTPPPRTQNTGGYTEQRAGGSRRSEVEDYARKRIDGALGAGTYDRYLNATGESILEKYKTNPRNLYWDEPNTPDGAINSYIRDEQNNAKNAAQWQLEHGNTPIPQEMWERWYYANRQGLSPNDVTYDGNQVVY